MNQDSTSSLVRSATHFFSGTMLSRIFGMGRDMAMAFVFGSSPLIAAFMMAFRFSNLLRRVFGEGALQSAFIPQFEALRKEDPKKAADFFKSLTLSLSLFLFALVLIVELGLWACLKSFDLSPANAEILTLTAWMFPGVIFICLFGVNSGLLQCERRFFSVGIAPVAFNVIWIIALFLLPDKGAMIILSAAIVFAYLCQWTVTLPGTFAFWRGAKTQLFSEDLRRLAKPLGLGILGVAAAQVNNSLDPIFARVADLEGPAFLWYAIRVQQLPLSLLGIAFAGALLPALSRASKSGDEEKYFHLLNFGLKRSLGLMIPITFAIFALGLPSISLLFGRGDFSQRAVLQTTFCLWGYGFGLLPMTATLLLASASYARNHFRLAAIASLQSMGLNAALNALFIFGFHLGSASVAVATSIASIFNCIVLMRPIWKDERWKEGLGRVSIRTTAASLLALVVTLTLGLLLMEEQLFSRELLSQLITLLIGCVLFFGTLLFGAKLFRASEILALVRVREELANERQIDRQGE